MKTNLSAVPAGQRHQLKQPTLAWQQPSKLEIDEYYGGAWNRSTLSGCIPLSPASTISGYLTLGKADRGYKYRLLVDYCPRLQQT